MVRKWVHCCPLPNGPANDLTQRISACACEPSSVTSISRQTYHGRKSLCQRSDCSSALTTNTMRRSRHSLSVRRKNEDSPFNSPIGRSKNTSTQTGKPKHVTRIKGVDSVCVICGEHTDTATGVSAEQDRPRRRGAILLVEGLGRRVNAFGGRSLGFAPNPKSEVR